MTVPKTISEKVTASLTLPFPSGAELKVSKNQNVHEGQVLALRKASSQTKSYHLSKLIGVPPSKTINFLVKKIGQKVKEGELIAQKKSLLKTGEKFTAPISGFLDSLTDDGILKIRKEKPEKQVKSPFKAVVKEASSNSVSLSFAALEIRGSSGSGSRKTGYLSFIEGEKDDLFSLNGSCKGQIIILQGILSKGLWYKAASLGVIGFVAGGLAKGIEINDDSLPLVVLGEDGKISQEIWKELKKAQGQMVLIDGQQKRLLIPKEK